MQEIGSGVSEAIRMLLAFDPEIYEIIGLSLQVSLTAVTIAACLGIPAGVLLGLHKFPGKGLVIRIIYTLMSLPPVIAGLLVFLLIMRKGPLGELGLSFTPAAMVIAQILLVAPIITGLTFNIVRDKASRVSSLVLTLGGGNTDALRLLIYEVRINLLAAVITGLGRAISEVGAVMIVGGNIVGKTRVMTTYIAQLQRMGNYDRAIAVGIVLLLISFAINGTLYHIQERDKGKEG